VLNYKVLFFIKKLTQKSHLINLTVFKEENAAGRGKILIAKMPPIQPESVTLIVITSSYYCYSFVS